MLTRSGWNYFWAFTGIGYIYILYLECKKGDVGYNRFGKPPLALDDNLLKENYNTQNVVEKIITTLKKLMKK